jgi:ABC-type uncharacterized transport system substrate-binding protein
VRIPVDIMIAVGTPASIAAKQATSSVPIVMIGVGYPIESGLAESMAHPGGNVTGLTTATCWCSRSISSC